MGELELGAEGWEDEALEEYGLAGGDVGIPLRSFGRVDVDGGLDGPADELPLVE